MAKKHKQLRALDVLKSQFDERDFLAESIYPVSYELPNKVDHTSKLNAIRDQGSQGACAGFAGACMKEVHEKVDVNLSEYLSPQFIYNSRENQNSEGMYMRDLMKILANKGVCTEDAYPYGTVESASSIPSSAKSEALNYLVESYASVNTIDACKRALYQNGPSVLAVPVYHYGPDMWKPLNAQDQVLGGHAMTIVGYDDINEYFIVRNSWGTGWGYNGYTHFPYSDWGLQWEIWTTIDADSDKVPEPVEPSEPDNKGCNYLARMFSIFMKDK